MNNAADNQRRRVRIRGRAATRLIGLYPKLYAKLVEEETTKELNKTTTKGRNGNRAKAV